MVGRDCGRSGFRSGRVAGLVEGFTCGRLAGLVSGRDAGFDCGRLTGLDAGRLDGLDDGLDTLDWVIGFRFVDGLDALRCTLGRDAPPP